MTTAIAQELNEIRISKVLKTMNTIENQILAILKDIDRPGEYCAKGTTPFVMPGLEVTGIGPIPLPLTQEFAGSLISVCRQAPYGQGTKTVVDTKVRNVWELDPANFVLRNPEWANCVAQITSKVQSQLGLGDRSIVSHLYKLLVYEKGGFFLPHKDGEKLDRMVATLVVALPSKHIGGELIVRHVGHETIIRFDDPAAEFQTSFAAFYSDCEHEVKTVVDGFRLCLVYNLVLADTGTSTVTAPDFQRQMQQLVPLFEKWRTDNKNGRMAVGLQHEYSADSLSLQNLKGPDQSRGTIISMAAEKAGCRATLGLLTLWESGYGEDGDESYHSRRSRYSSRDRSSSKSDYRMIEVYESDLSADQWAAFDGSSPNFGRLNFDENQLLSEKPILERKPEEEFEGFTGNAGMTLQRWYRQAIVAVWPKKAHYSILCGASTPAVAKELLRLARLLPRMQEPTRQKHREECRRFAGAIMSRWQFSSYATKESPCDHLLLALQRIGSRKRFLQFLNTIVSQEPSLSKFEVMARMCRRFGWQHCESGLKTIYAQNKGRFLTRNTSLLKALSAPSGSDAEQIKCCRSLCLGLLDALTVWGLQVKMDWEDQRVDTISLNADLIETSCRLQDEDLLRKLIVVVQSLTDKFDPVTVQIPAALRLISESRLMPSELPLPVHEWLKSLENLLESRTVVEPQPPCDFSRDAVLKCQCSVCKEVNIFLLSSSEKSYTYRARQDLRQHLDSQIHNDKADLSTETIRRGSPQSLLCTKTTESWKQRHTTWEHDLQSLASIRSFLSALVTSARRKTPAKKSSHTAAKRTSK